MAVEVVVPEEYMGPVNGDIISRRGQLEGTEVRGTTQIIKSSVPLSEMFGYVTDLRSRTQGRGSSTIPGTRCTPSSTSDQPSSSARSDDARTPTLTFRACWRKPSRSVECP